MICNSIIRFVLILYGFIELNPLPPLVTSEEGGEDEGDVFSIAGHQDSRFTLVNINTFKEGNISMYLCIYS